MIKPAAILFALAPFLPVAVPFALAQTAAPIASDAAKLAWVDAAQAGALNLRAGPSTDYRVLRVMKHGAPLTVLARDGNWARVVQHDTGTLGWVSARYVSPHDPQTRTAPKQEAKQQNKPKDRIQTIRITPTQAWVISPRGALNLRSGPGRGYHIRTSLPHGTRLTVLARHGDWREIRLKNGRRGWVHEDFVTRHRPIMVPSPKHGIRSIQRNITPEHRHVRGSKQDLSRMKGPEGRIVFRWSN